MKKKYYLHFMLLMSLMCAATPNQTLASSLGKDSNVVLFQEPRYQNIMSIVYTFRINNKNEAVYSAVVTTRSATKIKVETTLEKYINQEWTEIDTDSDYSNNTYFGYEGKTKNVDPDGLYRVYYYITVNYGNGQTEYTSQYKYYD